MAKILVVAEIAEGKVKKTTHSAISFARTAAQGTGGSFAILAIGAGAAGGNDRPFRHVDEHRARRFRRHGRGAFQR